MAPPQYPDRLRLPRRDPEPRAVCPSRNWPSSASSEPIHWVDVPGGTGGFDDKGYWLVTKHADVKEVSKRSDVFGSSPDGAIPTWPQGMTRDAIDLQKAVLLNMDAPQHTRLRKIISRGFTPRAVGRLEEELRDPRREHRQGRGGRGRRATSSSRCRASCRCRPSPVCSACRRRTATSCSAGPTR